MKLLISVLCLISIWYSSDVLAQYRCESIFGTEPNLGEFGKNAETMAPFYISMFRDLQTVNGINSNAGVMTKDIYNSSSEQFSTVVTSFKARPREFSTDNTFKEMISENIDFVVQSYSQRRDWSPELRDHLKFEAQHYSEQSTYIEVRRLDDETFTPRDLIGTMKIVRVEQNSPLKKLPLEVDFSVTMPNNAGRKFEPANFVVDKDNNKLGTSEIFTQLILHAREQEKNPRHEKNKMMYYTPADALGVKMYGKLGFTAVPGFEKPIKEGDKNWWMIGATAETLAHLPEKLSENRSQWSPEDVEWMSQLVKNFEGLQGSKTELFGTRTRNIKAQTGSVREMGVFVSEPFTHQHKNYRRLSVLSLDRGDIELNIRIPVKDYPLKNGWEMHNGQLHLFYKDGILKMYDTLLKTSLLIKVNGELTHPDYLYFKDRHHKLSATF